MSPVLVLQAQTPSRNPRPVLGNQLLIRTMLMAQPGDCKLPFNIFRAK